jgi:hypothetical protein
VTLNQFEQHYLGLRGLEDTTASLLHVALLHRMPKSSLGKNKVLLNQTLSETCEAVAQPVAVSCSGVLKLHPRFPTRTIVVFSSEPQYTLGVTKVLSCV